MDAKTEIRNRFNHLKRTPGPGPGWYSRAAKELGYTQGYVSMLARGLAKSPAALAALEEWKTRNGIQSEIPVV